MTPDSTAACEHAERLVVADVSPVRAELPRPEPDDRYRPACFAEHSLFHVWRAYPTDPGVTPPDPVLPVRACMSANVILRFVLLYTLPAEAIDRAVADITDALHEGALTPLPVHRFRLDDIAAAHEAVEKGVTGKVLVIIGDSPGPVNYRGP